MTKDINHVSIGGTLAKDPDLRKTAEGVPVANIALLTVDEKKSFIADVAVWGERAEEIAQLSKGDSVLIVGHLSLDTWERGGEVRQKLKIQCEEWA